MKQKGHGYAATSQDPETKDIVQQAEASVNSGATMTWLWQCLSETKALSVHAQADGWSC